MITVSDPDTISGKLTYHNLVVPLKSVSLNSVAHSGKGPCDALGGACKKCMHRGVLERKMDCTYHVADCVVNYMSTNHSDPDGWASFRNINTKLYR